MGDLLQYLVSGIALGGVYALVALGFVVIYRASRVFNFAHGELLAFGALSMVWLTAPRPDDPTAYAIDAPGLGLPWLVALPIVLAATGLLAALVERVALRPLVGRPVFVSIIITLFVGAVLRTAMILFFGATPAPLATPWDAMGAFDLAGARLGYTSAAIIAASALALAAFFALLRLTRLGVAMRATSSDQETALALGIPVGRVFAATWIIAGAFAALAGVSVAVRDPQVDPTVGFVALRAFPAVIVGGLESPLGAVLAGLLLGVAEVLCAAYLNDALGGMGRNFHIVMPYLVMIAVLIVRPYGLFGQRTVERL
ncbi:MAG: branched-chain amino acid ABC transporter permease [Myxococcales bacterium]|nr:branched-chain amino acid ABC transporter permease [Myxococcales bacterium]